MQSMFYIMLFTGGEQWEREAFLINKLEEVWFWRVGPVSQGPALSEWAVWPPARFPQMQLRFTESA